MVNINKKLVLVGILIISLLIFTGCQTNVNVDANELKNEGECRNAGGDYLWLAGRCCFDKNHNGNCDDDEGRRSCSNDCSQSGCMEDNQFKPYDCVVGEDGCLHRKVLGIQTGRCNVECLDNDGCRLGQKCVKYKCENKECGDGQCDDTENCNCVDCKVSVGSVCCNGNMYSGDCCTDSNCKQGKTCENNICKAVPKCGDGICQAEIGENCGNCTDDCKTPKDSICCSGSIVQGNCCSNEQCNKNETCIVNSCTLVQQTLTNDTEQPLINQTNSSGG